MGLEVWGKTEKGLEVQKKVSSKIFQFLTFSSSEISTETLFACQMLTILHSLSISSIDSDLQSVFYCRSSLEILFICVQLIILT